MIFYLLWIVTLCASSSAQTSVALTPTVRPADPFDVEKDVASIREALGYNSNKPLVIKLLTHRDEAQRLAIKDRFNIYNSDRHLKSWLTGLFHREIGPVKETLHALITPLPEFHANGLHAAMHSWTIDVNSIIEILVPLNNSEVNKISVAYEKLHDKKLVDDLGTSTSGHLRKLVVSLSRAGRDEKPVNESIIDYSPITDVINLVTIGKGQWATEESSFNAIMTTRSYTHLRRFFQGYEYTAKRSIETAISLEFGNTWEAMGYLTIVQCVRDKAGYFAKRLYESISCWGSVVKVLNRIILGRSEIDLGEIKEVYIRDYGHSLIDDIKDKISGYYRVILLDLVGYRSIETYYE